MGYVRLRDLWRLRGEQPTWQQVSEMSLGRVLTSVSSLV
jgi:hypothetical protein